MKFAQAKNHTINLILVVIVYLHAPMMLHIMKKEDIFVKVKETVLELLLIMKLRFALLRLL